MMHTDIVGINIFACWIIFNAFDVCQLFSKLTFKKIFKEHYQWVKPFEVGQQDFGGVYTKNICNGYQQKSPHISLLALQTRN